MFKMQLLHLNWRSLRYKLLSAMLGVQTIKLISFMCTQAKLGNGVGQAAPWSNEPIPKCSLFEPLLLAHNETQLSQPQQQPLQVRVHSGPTVMGYNTPLWELDAFGYRYNKIWCIIFLVVLW